jgi:hypothetical protein
MMLQYRAGIGKLVLDLEQSKSGIRWLRISVCYPRPVTVIRKGPISSRGKQ